MAYQTVVVGSGILGLATAYLAAKDGDRVLVVEAEDRPVHSSIMNFGHACFTGQADVIQPVAEQARNGWLSAAQDAGFWAAESGTWIPAVTELEMAVLQEFADHRGDEQVKLVTGAAVAESIGNPGLQAVGGAHLPWDVRVNPREAAPKIAHALERMGVDFRWNTKVTGACDGVVATSRGDFEGERVIVCPGDQLMGLFPDVAQRYAVRACTLLMALVAKPGVTPADLAMLTGTSLCRYDGFAAMPSVPALRKELASREPELVGSVANLMATSIPEGLLVGDSHDYALSPLPFMEENVADLLLSRSAEYLGLGRPKVLQRWMGHYADSPDTNLIVEQLDEKTTVLVVTSGIGMTLSFGVAALALRGETVENF
nr:N-methyltryptophan oxidase [Streptococcus thermophilus]